MSDNQTDNQGGTPFDDGTEQEVVQQTGRTHADGSSGGSFTLTPASDKSTKELLCDVRPIIPVIFLPGVMGSLLTDKNTGDELFFAPNTDGLLGPVGALPALIGLWFKNASTRETQFDPTRAAVTPLGPIKVGKHAKDDTADQFLDEDEARRRGWGSVHRTSYHPVLAWLEEQLNEPMLMGKVKGKWVESDPKGEDWTLKPVLDTDPADYGAVGKGGSTVEKLTQDSNEFKHFSKFRYRVYAIGYNWLQSNADSGQQVVEGSDYVDPKTKKTTRLMGIKEICAENHSGKAIILTHSMGGLVARMAIAMHGAEGLMHGVFHNVQPATGAPVAAKRFRTGGGNEGGMNSFVNGSLVGRDAAEFIAVIANAPGPLELIPMPDYNNGEPWWVFSRISGEVVMQFPKDGDAYNDVYMNPKWYGLIPESESSLLDPAGLVKARLDKNSGSKTVLDNFRDTMKSVLDKQRAIENIYHEKTYAAYNGTGALKQKSQSGTTTESGDKKKPSIEKGLPLAKVLTFGKVIWTGNVPSDVTEDELKAAKFMNDSHTGTVRVHLESRNLTIEFEVQKVAKLPNGSDEPDPDKNGIIAGDGTVPAWSADSQARGLKPGVKGDTAKGVQVAFVQGGYDHQGSYEHPWTRWSLLYSIVQIAQDAPEPSC